MAEEDWDAGSDSLGAALRSARQSHEGWRAMLGTDIDDENAPTDAYLFCPDCAEREFRPASRVGYEAIGEKACGAALLWPGA
jgi:hypothetical protein